MTEYICNDEHYSKVLAICRKAKKSLWLGTADIKDLYVEKGRAKVPFLEILADLVEKGVEVKLLHAKEPGKNFREDFDKYPVLFDGLQRRLCPRVHFKIVIIDGKTAYAGSANLTGAGIGLKSSNRRNFEAGVFSDEKVFVKQAQKQFESVFAGDFCKSCGRKAFCGDRIK